MSTVSAAPKVHLGFFLRVNVEIGQYFDSTLTAPREGHLAHTAKPSLHKQSLTEMKKCLVSQVLLIMAFHAA